eukprot:TRINITY_DN74559_c0_g1_i1.p1 TRINITY_DN74559_c0_g1~~TRINITY_DN74559_c0_g1_i1.p1  ORF type:complete len:201 (-),score=47.80 TRINITY_DN74559_c0_g1_i1:180-782(-)
MVEFKVEALDELDESQLGDCYVAVRVGDQQKLSRLSTSRVYRFPDAKEDTRTCKVEVFRRLGTCKVDADPRNQSVRTTVMDTIDPQLGRLQLRLGPEESKNGALSEATTTAAQGQGSSMASSQKPSDGKGKPAKAMATQDYIKRHGIEAALAEAMQQVLKERPENATEALALKLFRYSAAYKAAGDVEEMVDELEPPPLA